MDSVPMIVGALLVAVARVCDVTLGTLRIAFISKGEKFIAPFFAFFEMLIWLFAISQLARNIDRPAYYFCYAAGFATGVFVGLLVEEKLAFGTRVVRTITRMDASELVSTLRASNFGVTSVPAEGNAGPVNLIFSVIKRTDIPRYIDIVKRLNPNAFYSIEDVRFVSEGIFPRRSTFLGHSWNRLRMWAKFK